MYEFNTNLRHGEQFFLVKVREKMWLPPPFQSRKKFSLSPAQRASKLRQISATSNIRSPASLRHVEGGLFARNLPKIIEIALLLPPEKLVRTWKFAPNSASRHMLATLVSKFKRPFVINCCQIQILQRHRSRLNFDTKSQSWGITWTCGQSHVRPRTKMTDGTVNKLSGAVTQTDYIDI